MYWATGILGLAVAVAPFLFGYNTDSVAMWTSIILGLVVMAASIYEAMDAAKAKWEWWVVGIAGVLVVIAPFVFGLTLTTMALWTIIALGAILFIVAGYEVFFAQQPV
jgi:hypothetical protein